jgi:hypothetical protein
MNQPSIKRFLPAIQTLPNHRQLAKQDIVTKEFLLKKEGTLEMYYAPHNEYINEKASVLIIGITPGWKQMKTAYEQLVNSLAAGDKLELALKKTKIAAGFAGSMRTNLTRMLDECGLPSILNLSASSELFGESRHLLHTTSLIKYPVFVNGKNYGGHQPKINRSALLQHYAHEVFPKELAQIAPPALIIPLGKTVEEVMQKLAIEQKLYGHTYVTGFPHPSGANGHRVKQFKQHQSQLQKKMEAWGNTIH